MFATCVRQFADHVIDELAPLTATETEAGASVRLACLLDRASTIGADILAVIVEIVRARNVLDAAQATLVRAAERAGIPRRKRVRTAAGLLTEIGVPPAVAHRTARNGHHAERLNSLAQGLRDGSLSAEMADAVGKGVTTVGKRVGLGEAERTALVRKLLVQATPGDVAATARREGIRLVADSEDPDQIPAAENSGLNEMSVSTDEEGRITATADLDVLTGEELQAALDPLCRPVPLPDGSPDPRTSGQRRADALGQIIRTYLAGSQRPSSGGVLPHATLIVPTIGAPSDEVARLGFTGPVSPTTVALSLCTAAVTAVAVDGQGFRSMSGASTACSPRGFVRLSRSVMAGARSPDADAPSPGPMRITAPRGPAAGTPRYVTVCCCAGCTT